jgi:hypothetical protein
VSALLFFGIAAVSHAADIPFSSALTPEEFSAAGLNKLTPAELAKLNALIASPKGILVATAPGATSAAATLPTPRQPATLTATGTSDPAPTPPPPTAKPGFLARAKVLLTPGTEIEYTTLESKLLPPFNGWEKGTVLTLENGQRWQVTDSGSYWGALKQEPVPVKIVPGALGSFFMEIDGAGRPRVKLVPKPPTPTPAR